MSSAPSPTRSSPLPVTVLCGFLGAGKTTLLERLLTESGRRFAIIVNDLSELAVDAELIAETCEHRAAKLVNLNRGSLGGALREPFRTALTEFSADAAVEYLLIETSGATDPGVLVEEIVAQPGVQLDTFATVVDGLRLLRDFDGGGALLQRLDDPHSPRALMLAQIAPATVLLISKADLLTRPQAEAMITVLKRLNPRATIITMAYGSAPLKHLLGTRRFPSRATAGATASPDDPARFDLGSDVLEDARPFHPERLHALFTQRLPVGLHRSKGWLWLASRPADVIVWNQSGSQFGLQLGGTWRAALLADRSVELMPEEREALQARLAKSHPVFGDRACALTIIGAARERKVFLNELRTCLLTEPEVTAWQRGETFPDPWPTTFRQV